MLNIPTSSASPVTTTFSLAETLKIVKLREREGWHDRLTALERPEPTNIDPEHNLPQDQGPPLNFHRIAQILELDLNSEFDIPAEDVAKHYSRLRRKYDCHYDEIVDFLERCKEATSRPTGAGTSFRSQLEAVPAPRVFTNRPQTRPQSQAPSHVSRRSLYSGSTHDPHREPEESQERASAPRSRPHSRTPSHASSSSSHHTGRGSYHDPVVRDSVYDPGTRPHSRPTSHTSRSSRHSGSRYQSDSEPEESQEVVSGPRTRPHSRAPSQASRSSRHPISTHHLDHEPQGSQAMALAPVTRPHSWAPSQASRSSRHSGSRYHPNHEPEPSQGMVLPSSPAQQQTATSTTSRRRRSSAYNPRVPPPNGRMTLPYFLAGSYRSLGSTRRR